MHEFSRSIRIQCTVCVHVPLACGVVCVKVGGLGTGRGGQGGGVSGRGHGERGRVPACPAYARQVSLN